MEVSTVSRSSAVTTKSTKFILGRIKHKTVDNDWPACLKKRGFRLFIKTFHVVSQYFIPYTTYPSLNMSIFFYNQSPPSKLTTTLLRQQIAFCQFYLLIHLVFLLQFFLFALFFLLYTNTHTFFFWEFCISSMKWKHVAHFVFSDFLVEENGYKKILFSPNMNWIDVELFLFLPMINWDNFVLDDDDKYQTIHYSRSSSLKIKNSSTLRGALLTDSGKH